MSRVTQMIDRLIKANADKTPAEQRTAILKHYGWPKGTPDRRTA